ncbi:carcinine hydrolase/isopenicillin-N N-acyltransferase family protein [Candidatus Contubernalis alkalaceticus]|uniref:carcinine hydrolase/isopenicillin-N N-acyltransferase family protein n=1 Tax=Candidatus Contubernalis alkaliaceticus TaxID=338645 RepID=UPI002961EDD9|nr:carcinine hydrolase/isopenicillin-N N-acyltransferase family protein [Candidatus Contubernalis alkalaceticus]UNC93781.1 hypothetical protein HUE98_03455 [Candidatus Contubernalis alkalaceticus]
MADASEEIFGLESIHNDREVLKPRDNIIVHTNHYLTERLKTGDMAAQIFPDSFKRIERIRYLMDEHYDKITPKVMIDILSDHENYPYSICRHVDSSVPPQYQSSTLASFIMVPEDGVMYAAAGNPCSFQFAEYMI